MLLPSLRSTITRSPKPLVRTYASTQANAQKNEDVIRDIFGTFGSQSDSERAIRPEARQTRTPNVDNTIPPAQDPLLEFFASRMMQGGKRARAEKATSEILLHIHALTKAPPLPVLRQAVQLAAPAVRVMSHKMGGKALVKPIALNERQRTRRAIGWILEESNSRPGHTRGERVARECIGILQKSSRVLELKDKAHQVALINRGNVPRSRV